jgi:hypothetical protein
MPEPVAATVPPSRDRQDRFCFIVGCGRSGTTLLRAMLDAHPEVAVPYESHWVVAHARRRHVYERGGRFDVVAFCADLATDERFARWGVDLAGIEESLRRDPVATYPDAVRRVYARYAAQRGKPRYANKTGKYVLRIPELVAMFPEAVFVHLVRDGRNVALSRRAVAWGSDRFDEAVLSWREQVRAGRRAARRLGLGPQRYLEVRYEHLVADPEEVARRLCEFLHLAYDPAMLDTTAKADEIIGQVLDPAEHQNLRLPPTPGLRDWRTEMAPREVALFEALAGGTLTDFGYPRAPGRPAAGVRVEALARAAARQAGVRWSQARSWLWWRLHPDGEPSPPTAPRPQPSKRTP